MELKERIAQGESSTLQFKLKWSDNNAIAKELVAFANSRGGTVAFGVEDKTGRIAAIRNPQMALFCSKTMTYRGLGSGILRAINDGAKVELRNDVEHDKVVAIIWRESLTGGNKVPNDENKVPNIGALRKQMERL